MLTRVAIFALLVAAAAARGHVRQNRAKFEYRFVVCALNCDDESPGTKPTPPVSKETPKGTEDPESPVTPISEPTPPVSKETPKGTEDPETPVTPVSEPTPPVSKETPKGTEDPESPVTPVSEPTPPVSEETPKGTEDPESPVTPVSEPTPPVSKETPKGTDDPESPVTPVSEPTPPVSEETPKGTEDPVTPISEPTPPVSKETPKGTEDPESPVTPVSEPTPPVSEETPKGTEDPESPVTPISEPTPPVSNGTPAPGDQCVALSASVDKTTNSRISFLFAIAHQIQGEASTKLTVSIVEALSLCGTPSNNLVASLRIVLGINSGNLVEASIKLVVEIDALLGGGKTVGISKNLVEVLQGKVKAESVLHVLLSACNNFEVKVSSRGFGAVFVAAALSYRRTLTGESDSSIQSAFSSNQIFVKLIIFFNKSSSLEVGKGCSSLYYGVFSGSISMWSISLTSGSRSRGLSNEKSVKSRLHGVKEHVKSRAHAVKAHHAKAQHEAKKANKHHAKAHHEAKKHAQKANKHHAKAQHEAKKHEQKANKHHAKAKKHEQKAKHHQNKQHEKSRAQSN